MLSIRGVYQNNAIRLLQPVTAQDGQNVIIVFLDEAADTLPLAALSPVAEADWSVFEQLTETHTVRTGIADLAHQHDHYLYGKSKTD